MATYKYYWPLLTALIIYSILSFFWGRTGIQSIKEMENIRFQLEQNLNELNQINSNLNDNIKSFGSDPERIVIQSRDLSYIKDHEKILFMNLSGTAVSQADVGKILHLEIKYDSPESLFKWISFLFFMTGMVLTVLFGKRQGQQIS